MATVRLTDSIRNRVVNSFESIYERRIDAVRQELKDTVTPEEVYGALMGQYTSLIEQSGLPKAMFPKVKELDIGMNFLSISFELSSLHPFSDNLEEHVPFVKSSNQYYPRTCQRIRLEDEYDYTGMVFDKFKQANDKIKGIKEEMETGTRAIRTLLEKFATLSPALKEWPPLWDLLDENTKDKHKQIQERKKSQKAERDTDAEVDTKALTAAVIASKLGA